MFRQSNKRLFMRMLPASPSALRIKRARKTATIVKISTKLMSMNSECHSTLAREIPRPLWAQIDSLCTE